VRHYAGGIADWVEHGGPVEGPECDGSVAGQGAAAPRLRGSGGAIPLGGRKRPAPQPSPWWIVRLLEAIADLSFGALFVLWLGVVLGCGVAYWLLGLWRPSLLEGGAPVASTLEGFGTAVYFSFITATSVGYGDVVPHGASRVLAGAESVMGLLLVGCVISKLVSRRQEELVAEIHHTTFEDRLGRVRTNLHLVLSELQWIAKECARQTLTEEQAMSRVESVAMVFAGELRVVHDLLYRPQQAPEEAVLQALLAQLCVSLKELCDALQACPVARGGATLLPASIHSISVLAAEICGNCVPREYAPELKGWMDRINELARKLTAWGA
jgi:hypothetical protein